MTTAILGVFCFILVFAVIAIAWGANRRRRAGMNETNNADAPTTPHTGRATGPD